MEYKKYHVQNKEPDTDYIKDKKIKYKMITKDSQSQFSTFNKIIKENLSKVNKLMEQADFLQIKNIDLCKAMNGTVFKTQINKLCDIKMIIKSIEFCFACLPCDHCNQQAIYACEENQGTQYYLFCEDHFEKLGPLYQTSINLINELMLIVIILNELESYLIRLQERIEYFRIEKDKKNPDLYKKTNGLIEYNFDILKSLLGNLESKYSKINQNSIKTIKSKMKYEDISLLKDECNKCRNIIFKILSMIPRVCDKIETNSLIQMIVNSNQEVPLGEEIKESLSSSIPDSIYGNEYQFVNIPTQSFVQLKEFENKIKSYCKVIETCVKYDKDKEVLKLKDIINERNNIIRFAYS